VKQSPPNGPAGGSRPGPPETPTHAETRNHPRRSLRCPTPPPARWSTTKSARGRLLHARRSAGQHLHARDDGPARRGDPQGPLRREVHVLVLTGQGDRMFCAGANINMLKALGSDLQVLLLPARQRDAVRLEQTPKLVIAALNGNTVGGGLEIAMAADLRHRQERLGQGRPARGLARRAPRHRRHAAAGAHRRQVARDRADGDRRPVRRRRAVATASSTRSSTPIRATPFSPRSTPTPPVLPAEQGGRAVGRIKRAVQSAPRSPSSRR
jgi:hypothetical protein